MFLSSFAFAGNVDLEKSVIKWEGGKKFKDDRHYGKIKLKSGKLDMNDKGQVVGGELVVDMDSISVDDLQGKWATKFLSHMKNEDFFNVPKYPVSTLMVTSIKDGVLKGKMKILDKTRSVEIPLKKSGNAYVGSYSFDRTKWGIKYGSDSFFKGLGDKVIKNQIKLDFKISLK